MPGRRKFIGLMSGTSCDGVDAALVEIAGSGLKMRVAFLDHYYTPFSDALRNALLAVMAPARTRTEDLASLNMEVGQTFAECASRLMEQAGTGPDQIAAIGSHGQTICHLPDGDGDHRPCTYQIGEPAVIAAECAATVVADFRAADLALGGQGAPLVPWTDYILFASKETTRILQNIGGIANLTYLPVGQGPDSVIAFDTGPGCMVIDAMMRRLSERKHDFDPDGQYAARGSPDIKSVEKTMQLPYFKQPPPKSAGREQFGKSFVSGMRQLMRNRGLSKYDQLATGTLLTARSIAQAYRVQPGIDLHSVEVILCGGGARNATLLKMLQAELPDTEFKMVDDLGIPLQAKESVSFAMLAAACLDGIPANLPQVTGARRHALLGKIIRV